MLMSMADTWSRLKRLIFHSTFWLSIVKKVFRLMADEEWGDYEKKKWLFWSCRLSRQACVSSPVTVNVVDYLGLSLRVVRGVVYGVLREARVDKSFLPLSTLVVALHFSMEKQPKPWTALPFEIPLSTLSNWVMCLKIPENTLTSLYFCCNGQSTSWSFGDMTLIKSWERRFAHESTLWSFYGGNLTFTSHWKWNFRVSFPTDAVSFLF